MLRVSPVGIAAATGSFFPAGFYFLCDSGYTLAPWMLVPYAKISHLDMIRSIFNFKHSGARMKGTVSSIFCPTFVFTGWSRYWLFQLCCLFPFVFAVEQTFGRLKGRWLILLGTQIAHPRDAAKVALACAVLHNLCNGRADSAWRQSWEVKQAPFNFKSHATRASINMANFRDTIANSLITRLSRTL